MPQQMVTPGPEGFNDMDLTIMKMFAALKEKEQQAEQPQGQPPFQPTTPEQDVFNQGEQGINAMQPPTPATVPGTPNPLAAFLSQLAGNIGSSLAENPTYAQNTSNILSQRRTAADTAKAANEAAKSEFEQKREEMRLQNRLKFAEAQSKRAIEKGDRQMHRDAEELKLRLQNKMDALKAGASSAELDKRLQNELEVARTRVGGDIAVQQMREKGAEKSDAAAMQQMKLKDFLAEEQKRFGGDPTKTKKIGLFGVGGEKQVVDDDALAEQVRFYASARKTNKAGDVRDYIDSRMENMLQMKFGDLNDPNNKAAAAAWLKERGIK